MLKRRFDHLVTLHGIRRDPRGWKAKWLLRCPKSGRIVQRQDWPASTGGRTYGHALNVMVRLAGERRLDLAVAAHRKAADRLAERFEVIRIAQSDDLQAVHLGIIDREKRS